MLDRVVAEEGGEQGADRRERADLVRGAAGTPCAVRPPVSVGGSELASPATISEKKMPMDSTMPAFWKVARMPEAAPRWRAGTLDMIADVFGAANRPLPTPARKISGRSPGS